MQARAGLLGQPSSFESLGVIPEELQVDDPAIAQREDVRRLDVRLRALADATPDLPDENSVCGPDEVTDRFHRVRIPGRAELVPFAHERLPADERPGLGPALRGPRHHVGVEELTEGVHVSLVPRLVGGPDYLDVLLRHLQASIALGPYATE